MTIIIVNFNGGKEIAILAELLVSSNFRLVIVDNGATDDNMENLREIKFKNFSLIENKENVGFAKAVNIGIKSSLNEDEGFLLLNPDVEISEEQIDKIRNSKYDISSPALKFKRGDKWIYDYGGRMNWLIGRAYHIEKIEIDSGSEAGMTAQIDYVSGACMYIKKRVIAKIGLLDEQFFMYFEDVDFCLRAKKAGFSVGVIKDVIVGHNIEEHKTGSNPLKKKYVTESNLKFVQKWVQNKYRLLAYIYFLLLEFR